MVHDDRHRKFLQAIMQGGVVLDQDASELIVKIFDQRLKPTEIARLINEKLSPLDMEMKYGTCEMTGDRYWSVVGTTHEDAVRIPSSFSLAETSFLRSIYTEIIGSIDGSVSSTECLNLSTALDRKLTLTDADKFLKVAVSQKYLHCKDGYYYMGVRSIVELMPYFRAMHQDNFNNCILCREVVFHGQRCEHCEKLFHHYCVAKYTTMQKESKCPQCKQELNMSHIPDEVMASQTLNMETEEDQMDISEDDRFLKPANKTKSKKRMREQ